MSEQKLIKNIVQQVIIKYYIRIWCISDWNSCS